MGPAAGGAEPPTPSARSSSPSARALAFRGARSSLDAPPHALLGGALDDGFVTHVHEEKGRADAGAEGV